MSYQILHKIRLYPEQSNFILSFLAEQYRSQNLSRCGNLFFDIQKVLRSVNNHLSQ